MNGPDSECGPKKSYVLAVVYCRGLSVMLYQFIYVSLNVISRPPLFCVLYYYFFMCVTVSIALLYAH